MCLDLCQINYDINSEQSLLDRIDQQTQVTINVDEFGNLSITDPQNELGAQYSDSVGNLSGNGTRVNRFFLDRFGNFKYNI